MEVYTVVELKEIQKSIRGSIFFLLLCVDPKTADSYPDVDVNKIFENLLDKLDGYNTLLLYPLAIADTMSLLQQLKIFTTVQCLNTGNIEN